MSATRAMNLLNILTAFVLALICASKSFAYPVSPESCVFKKLQYERHVDEKKLGAAIVEQNNIRVLNKQEGCGALEVTLITIKGENAKAVNEIIESNRPTLFRSLQTRPQMIEKILPTKVKESELDTVYRESADWLHHDIFSLSHLEYRYTGGAHGSTTISKAAYRISTQEIMKLEEVLLKKHQAEILSLATQQFRQEHQLSETDPWNKLGIWLPAEQPPHSNWVGKDGFYLPENFNLTEKGIVFIFQQYEIGPYSMGLLEFTLPWDKIKPYLVPGSEF